MNFVELKSKEIISVTDGRKLGFCDDVVIDSNTNTVRSLKIPLPSKPFKKIEHIEIEFNSVILIGTDCILVDLNNGPMVSDSKSREYCYSPKQFRRVNNEIKN